MGNIKDIIDKFRRETNITLRVDGNNFYYYGDMNLRPFDEFTLPNNLIIVGNLNLNDTNITELPENLTVCGNLLL